MGRYSSIRALGVASLVGLATPPAFSMVRCPPDSAAQIQAAISVLDSPMESGNRLELEHRIQTVDNPVLRCPGPSPVPALFRLFLRSRYGGTGVTVGPGFSLPEDPDLFERALAVLANLPPEQVAAGASAGLGEGLRLLTWQRLLHDWIAPASSGLPTTDRQWFANWRPPEDLADSASALVGLVEAHPTEALSALTTGGGSLAQDVAGPLQDELLATLLLDVSMDPARARAVLGVIADSGAGRHHVGQALRSPALDHPELRTALERARRAVGAPLPAPSLALPVIAPGRKPGLEALAVPTMAPADVVVHQDGRAAPRLAWTRAMAGLGIAILALVVAVRRPRLRSVVGPAFGVGLLVLTDGLVDGFRWAPSASDHPLFQFIAQSSVSADPIPGGQLFGGGSMRLQRIPTDPVSGLPRVVFLGASSVHGSHYRAEEAFPARISAHGLPIEPINFGIGGTTSAGVAAAGEEALSLQPAALVVMYGHNEAAQFTRLALYEHTRPTDLRLRFWLSHSGWYRLLSQALSSQPKQTAPPNLYRTVAPSRSEVAALIQLSVDHLRRNLGNLFEAAAQQGVPVVLVLPPTNLRFAHLLPFETPGPGDAEDLARLQRSAEEAAARGDGSTARLHLQTAIDRSASPREIVTPIRTELVSLGRTHGLLTVDAQSWMCAHAPDGVTPSGLFWDDIHPTAEGHDALARMLAPVLRNVVGTAP